MTDPTLAEREAEVARGEREAIVQRGADAVLRASGSKLAHYSMAGTRAAIFGAIEGIQDAARHSERSRIIEWLIDMESHHRPFGCIQGDPPQSVIQEIVCAIERAAHLGSSS